MSKVINIVGYSSNVGKTLLIENLIKELKSRGYSIATIKHDVHGFDIDKKVDVKTLMEKQWGLLSGGERKYLYSMVLLSLDREWYILDEPFAYLDTEKKEILWKVIEAFASEGKGVILTSHEEDSRINGSDIHVINLD